MARHSTATLAVVALMLSAAVALSGCKPDAMQRNAATSCAPEWKKEPGDRLVASLPTDAGMHALWDPQAFQTVCDFDAWAREFVENHDIERHIATGSVVPIYVHADGAPLFDLRVGSAQAPARFDPGPDMRITRRARPYLFVSTGMVGLSGIEYANGYSDEGARFLGLPAGRWRVEVIEVDPRQGLDAQRAEQVPNFVILLNPEADRGAAYRQNADTFDQPARPSGN